MIDILNGKELSLKLRDEMKSEVKGFMIKPCLAVIQIGDAVANNMYVEAKKEFCNEIGMYFKHIKFDELITEKEIMNKIIELNNDEYVDGVIIQLPLPAKYNEKRIINYILKNKDIDGLTDANRALLLRNKATLIPCAPLGIIKLLKEYKIEISGKNVVIIGRSSLVGIPLMHLLLNENATITVCHSKTESIKKHTLEADILITATGVKHLITKDMVKKDSVVIDVGMYLEKNKIYGDVDFDSVKDVVSYITPVPGGVGPMTVAMTFKNVIDTYKKKNNKI